MEELSLSFLPYPHVFKGERRSGIHIDWPERCSSCDRQCESSATRGIQLCSYGVNYCRVDDDLLIAGVVVRDFTTVTSASAKMRRRIGKGSISIADLEAVVTAAKRASDNLAQEFDRMKSGIMEEYRRSEKYRDEAVELLRPDIQKALAQVHDYRQFVSQIIQNVNVILQLDHPGEETEKALDASSHEIQAIYWAARLMERKLEAALFLMYPERVSDPSKQEEFRLHGLITKYVKIYDRSLRQRDIRIRRQGLSWGSVRANPDAVGVIPHAFLDNAVKYAPSSSEVVIDFQEGNDTITFSVRSIGPRIGNDERSRIFDLFYRGRAAQVRTVDGTGFGLALARHVADRLGATLHVDQDGRANCAGLHRTTFSAVFQKLKV